MNWNLKNIYETENEFNNDFNEAKKAIESYKKFKGHLNEPNIFAQYLETEKKMNSLLNKLYPYVSLAFDLNKKDSKLNANLQKVTFLFEEYNEATSYCEPEYLKLGLDTVLKMIPEELKEFEFLIRKVFHCHEHVLDEKTESIIATTASIPDGGDIYSALAVGDSYNNTVLIDGKEIEITNGNYQKYISECNDAKKREEIFEAVFSKYNKNKNAYAEIYLAQLKRDWAYAKIRGYKSSLEARLFSDNIDRLVYTTLIEVANETSNEVKRYINLRKKYFNLDEYHTYDRFLKMGSFSKEYTYDEAKDLFFKSIENVDPRLKNNLHRALEDGYVDVYEKPGKRTGAYSSGSVGIHPYILLNYSSTLEDVFTIAHEAGHSSHTLFSSEAQPLMLADYTIFVAEIASTFNEHILLDYLINNVDSNEEKLSLIQKEIDNIIATFYRQTLFAEYELKAHTLVENGNPITADTLSDIMIELYKNYYDLDITKEESKRYVWAYIPHLFYTPFYVYQYATCFAASLKIFENIKKDNNYDSYIKMLEAGGSNYSLDIVKISGVDLTKKEAFIAVSNRLKYLNDKLEEIIDL